MSRSISQIYAEAVEKRNEYLQLTEFNNGEVNNNSTNKLSVMNVLTFVMATLIHIYESILDTFEVDIATILNSRIHGPAAYYLTMAKKFQYVSTNATDDRNNVVFNEDTLKIEYKKVDSTVRIISKVASETEYDEPSKSTTLILKVCKDYEDADISVGESPYQSLSDDELTSFKSYIQQIAFIGAKIKPISLPGDIMTVRCNVVYDSRYVTAQQAFENVRKSLVKYITDLEYNGYIYYQSIIDAIQKADYVLNIPTKDADGNDLIHISFEYWSTEAQSYIKNIFNEDAAGDAKYSLTDRYKPHSGYLMLKKGDTSTVTFRDEEDGDGNLYFVGTNPMES